MMILVVSDIILRVWSEQDVSEELSEKIEELVFWARYSAWKTFIADLKVTLRDDVDKLVYELSDGKNSTRDIAQIVSQTGRKVTHVTVANMWQKWSSIPLVLPASRTGRYKKIVSLKLAGIDVPSVGRKAIEEE
jgi:hypothetical protein